MQALNFKFQISNFKSSLFAFLIFNFAFAPQAFGQIAAGGAYTLEKSVTGTGGATSSGGSLTVAGTIGQFGVGAAAQGAPYVFYPGFWTPASLAPTASAVSLSGRVRTISGLGIGGARITLTGAGGETRSVTSSMLGYYRFTDVPAGETYVLTIYAKRLAFANPTQIVTLADARDDVDFIAESD